MIAALAFAYKRAAKFEKGMAPQTESNRLFSDMVCDL